MLHELTITVDDTVYQTLKPMIDQKTIGSLLYEFMQNRTKQPFSSIVSLRGTLHKIDTSDIREETDRAL